MAPHVGAHCLEKENGGRGVLLGGVPGVPPATVVILGGGVAGSNAAFIAAGLGADVTVRRPQPGGAAARRRAVRHRGAHRLFDARCRSRPCAGAPTSSSARCWCRAPRRPSSSRADMVKAMKPGSVIVDIAIDQGGCAETSRPTTHSHPTYVVDDVVHYCVTNMPGAVARTSTFALNNVTIRLCLRSPTRAAVARWRRMRICATASMCTRASVTHRAVADALKQRYTRARRGTADIVERALAWSV